MVFQYGSIEASQRKKNIYREILRYISLFRETYLVISRKPISLFRENILLFRENMWLFREKHLVISRKISHYFAKNILLFHGF